MNTGRVTTYLILLILGLCSLLAGFLATFSACQPARQPYPTPIPVGTTWR